jgi:hypothetical protein
MNLFSSLESDPDSNSACTDRAALQARVKVWVREALALDDSVGITVNELRC